MTSPKNRKGKREDISSYNALFDIEKSVIEGENCLFLEEKL